MPKKSRPKTHHGQMLFRGKKNRFLRTDSKNKMSSPAKTKDRQISRKIQIRTIHLSTSTRHRIFILLSELSTWIGKATHSVFSTTQHNGRQRQTFHHP